MAYEKTERHYTLHILSDTAFILSPQYWLDDFDEHRTTLIDKLRWTERDEYFLNRERDAFFQDTVALSDSDTIYIVNHKGVSDIVARRLLSAWYKGETSTYSPDGR